LSGNHTPKHHCAHFDTKKRFIRRPYLLAGMVLHVDRFKFRQVDEQVGCFPVIIRKVTGDRTAADGLLPVETMITLIVIIGSSRFFLLLLIGVGQSPPHHRPTAAGAPQNQRHHPEPPNQFHHDGQRKGGKPPPSVIDFLIVFFLLCVPVLSSSRL
jgi:hypothetical protein